MSTNDNSGEQQDNRGEPQDNRGEKQDDIEEEQDNDGEEQAIKEKLITSFEQSYVIVHPGMCGQWYSDPMEVV